MKYQWARPRNPYYDQEATTGTDVRMSNDTWSKIETGLKTEYANKATLNQQIKDLKQNRSANAPGGNGSSGDRKNIPLGKIDQATLNNIARANELRLFKAKENCQAKIDHYKEWLKRERATANETGDVQRPLLPTVVVYDKDAQSQGLTKVELNGGKLYVGTGKDRKILDTAAMVTHFSGPGYAIFVMTAEGNIHIGSHVVGEYHHTSLLGGVNVACAGEIQVKDGKISFVSNKSGHYEPDALHFNQVIHKLDKIKQSNCQVRFHQKDVAPRMFASTDDYRNSITPDDLKAYELAKTLSHNAYIWNDKGDLHPRFVEKGWRWQDPTNQNEQPGFYDKDGNAVAHKDVRTFIKQDEDYKKSYKTALPTTDDVFNPWSILAPPPPPPPVVQPNIPGGPSQSLAQQLQQQIANMPGLNPAPAPANPAPAPANPAPAPANPAPATANGTYYS